MTNEHDDKIPDNVIEIESIRHGYKKKECNCGIHAKFFIDKENHKVECDNCGNTVEPFAALLSISETTSRYREEIDKLNEHGKKLANYKPRRRIIKQIEDWYNNKRPKMYPRCPHCREAFELDELARVGNWTADMLTHARMKKKKRKKDKE